MDKLPVQAKADALKRRKKKPVNWRDLPTEEWPNSTAKRKAHDSKRFKVEAELRGEEAEKHFAEMEKNKKKKK
jgi:hypothetical protein